MKTAEQRFDEKWEYRVPWTCWFWTKGMHAFGYGMFWDGRAMDTAHHYAYVSRHGMPAKGMHLDHFVCDNPGCANPDHVRVVTHRENILRGNTVYSRNAAKTHCPAGHEYNKENTNHRRGARECRICIRAR